MRGYFVTGTDTGCGKTLVTLSLLKAFSDEGQDYAGMKPVASGAHYLDKQLRNEDAQKIWEQMGGLVPYERINPYVFEPPVAPHLAAAESGVNIDFTSIRKQMNSLAEGRQGVLVEGVGGWRVPLGTEGDVAGLARYLGFPVILVVGLRLGCINHALLTAEAIQSDGLVLAGWIGSQIEPGMDRLSENITTLKEILPTPCLGILPYMPSPDIAIAANELALDRLR